MGNRYKYTDEGRQHLHTLDSKPLVGASTFAKFVGGGSKDHLMQWYADKAAVAGLALPQQDIKADYEAVQAIADWKEKANAKKELDKKYPDFAEARRAAVSHRDESAKTGTLRHGVLEGYIKECIEKNEGKPIGALNSEIKVFVDWAIANVAEFYFTEANCYHEELWLGGIADLGLKLKSGKRLIGDHKSSKSAYADQFLQTAIYDLLLSHSGILDKDGNKLGEWQPADGYVIFPFRSEPFTPEFKWETEKWKKAIWAGKTIYEVLELEFGN